MFPCDKTNTHHEEFLRRRFRRDYQKGFVFVEQTLETGTQENGMEKAVFP